MGSKFTLYAAAPEASVYPNRTVPPGSAADDGRLRLKSSPLRFLAGLAIAGALFLTGSPTWATPTTITLTASGALTVDSAGTLTATLAAGLPSDGFFDVFTGVFMVSETHFPTLPVTQPYDFALTGSLSVGPNVYTFDNTHISTETAAEVNSLAMDAENFVASPSGNFFPSLIPNTFYTYDTMDDITVASQTNLASVLPDIGPLSAFFMDGTYAISTTGLTLVATPIPEPASIALFGAALFGLRFVRRKKRLS
jgi:hypothetical protein